MSKIIPALQFLKQDLEKAKPQWREGKEWESLLQREGVNLEQLLDIFDPEPDESAWVSEYSDKRRARQLILYRARMAFLKASRKEWHEEYDPDVTDVDYMRLLELPFTDPKYVIEYSMVELKDK
jgi:hypothetical protein